MFFPEIDMNFLEFGIFPPEFAMFLLEIVMLFFPRNSLLSFPFRYLFILYIIPTDILHFYVPQILMKMLFLTTSLIDRKAIL